MKIHKVSPNCGRKRMANPALMRTTPTSSHGTKMASIFRDAADSMEGFETPSRNSTSHDQKFRMPISHARTTPFGYKNSRYVGNSDAENSPGIGFSPRSSRETPISPHTTYKPGLAYPLPVRKTPIKTGLGSHEVQHPKHKRQLSPPTMSDLDIGPTKIQYPQLTKANPRMARSSTSSLVSDCHSSHGVPLVIPLLDKSEKKMDSIDTWLTEVVSPLTSSLSNHISQGHDITPERKKRTNVYPTLPPQPLSAHPTRVPGPFSKTTKPIKPLAPFSNNKENAPPSQSTRDSPSHSSALMRSPASVKLSPTRLYSALSPSPLSPLNQPPRRMTKALVSPHAAFAVPSAPTAPFTIHEDDCGSDIPPLSPNVELHRKGRSPRRERCASYWDDDLRMAAGDRDGREERNEVLGEAIDREGDGSSRGEIRKGKKVLGVSKQSEKWTREKPFVHQAEGAPFGFRARMQGDGRMDVTKGYF